MSHRTPIRKWLRENDRTLTWLMLETRLSWATVSRVANGRNVRLDTALKLSKATKLPYSTFTNEGALAA